MTSGCPRVLIVDDEEAIRDLLHQILDGEGYVSEAAASAEMALEKLQERSFDVVLLDIMMPGASGIELLSTLRESFEGMSVLIVTAVNDAATMDEAVGKGAFGYILKPFSIEEVRAKVGAALNGKCA